MRQNVVEEAVGLLLDVLDGGDTSTVRKLYKTGLYFFALSYSGSNLTAIAKVRGACITIFPRLCDELTRSSLTLTYSKT